MRCISRTRLRRSILRFSGCRPVNGRQPENSDDRGGTQKRAAAVFTSLLLFFPILIFSAPAVTLGHFGDLPPLMVVPKELPAAQSVLVEPVKGGVLDFAPISRLEYATFLRTMAEITVAIDPLQRRFSATMDFIVALSRHYSGDINDLRDSKAAKRGLDPHAKEFLSRWAVSQAELLALLEHAAKKFDENFARPAAAGSARRVSEQSDAVLKQAATSLKARFLDELIGWTEIEPSPAGLAAHVQKLAPGKRRDLHLAIADPRTADPARAAEMRRRLIAFRRGALAEIEYSRPVAQITFEQLEDSSVLARVGDFELNYRYWQAVFGPADGKAHWNAVKDSTIGQTIVNFAMARQAEQNGVIPADVERKVAMLSVLYRAAEYLLRQLPEAQTESGELPSLELISLAGSPGKLREILESEPAQAAKRVKIDREYLSTVEWAILTPDSKELPQYF